MRKNERFFFSFMTFTPRLPNQFLNKSTTAEFSEPKIQALDQVQGLRFSEEAKDQEIKRKITLMFSFSLFTLLLVVISIDVGLIHAKKGVTLHMKSIQVGVK